MISIYVPTYNKDELPILKFLEDEDIRLVFCIRHEEVNRRYYKDLKKQYKDRIDFVDLGDGIDNLGETRKRIIDYCINNNVRYCFMFDDGLTSVEHTYDILSNDGSLIKDKSSLFDVLVEALTNLVKHEAKFEECFCYTFNRRGNSFLGVSEKDEYFTSFPLQAQIINTEKCKKYNLNYEDMKICGLEDVAFFMDAVKRGLIFCSNQQIVIDGKLPNVVVKGGSHNEKSIEDFIKKRDYQHQLLMKYVGNCYGIMLTKKYRESLGFKLTYARVDLGYFRDVLVYHRKEDEDIIKNQFRID